MNSIISMPENTSGQPDAFDAFVVLFRYAASQAKKNSSAPSVEFDPATMIDALRKLYNTGPDLPSHYWNAPMLLTGLEKILAQTGQEKLLDNLDVSENLQIVGLLLDAILADSALSNGTTPYFRRLQFPLLIAAFSDPTLLKARTHPAREMLNQLALLSLSVNDQGEIDNPTLLQSLEQAIGIITVNSASNPAVFVEALETLSRLTRPLVKSFALRLERVIDTCLGGHRLDQARLLVSREINVRLGGKPVPKIILDLLAGGWQQLLVLTCLREGTDDEAWRRELDLIDQLLENIDNQGSSTQLSRSHVQKMKSFMLESLYSVGADHSTANHLADAIEKLLLQESEENSLEYIDVPSADTDGEERKALVRNRLQGFSEGDWLKFAYTWNVWMPLRLTWIGHDPMRYVFVTQKGVKSLDLDAERFVQILDQKRAKRIESLEDIPIVERAAKSLLYTLRERMR